MPSASATITVGTSPGCSRPPGEVHCTVLNSTMTRRRRSESRRRCPTDLRRPSATGARQRFDRVRSLENTAALTPKIDCQKHFQRPRQFTGVLLRSPFGGEVSSAFQPMAAPEMRSPTCTFTMAVEKTRRSVLILRQVRSAASPMVGAFFDRCDCGRSSFVHARKR